MNPGPYTVEARWQWYLQHRLLPTHGDLAKQEVERMRAVFYTGFGECIDMLGLFADSQASEAECRTVFYGVQDEIRTCQTGAIP